MRRFEREGDGAIVALVDEAEVALLRTLTQQAADVVARADLGDAAVLRLLPDAYSSDAEASAEFRRFTQDDVAGRKLANAARILDALDATEGEQLRIESADVLAWLRGLNDLRLILATRLGIESDEDADEGAPSADPVMRDVYDWLGFVQNSLVEAIDG